MLQRLPQLASRLAVLARRWLKDRLADAADADDLVQDVLLTAIRAWESYQGQTEVELQSWLAAILRHRALNLLHREGLFQALREQLAQPVWQPGPESDAAEDVSEHLAARIESLPHADRELILLRFVGELDWAELGYRLGITADAARKRASRALSRLNVLLRGPAEGEDGRR
jgi:RNA polymerase sigma-70 factor (ECF subfamily)